MENRLVHYLQYYIFHYNTNFDIPLLSKFPNVYLYKTFKLHIPKIKDTD